jgi:hypothetical protein
MRLDALRSQLKATDYSVVRGDTIKCRPAHYGLVCSRRDCMNAAGADTFAAARIVQMLHHIHEK